MSKLVLVKYEKKVIFVQLQESDSVQKLKQMTAEILKVKDYSNFEYFRLHDNNYKSIEVDSIKNLYLPDNEALYLKIGDEEINVPEYQEFEQ